MVKPSEYGKTYVLVHGCAHGAWAFEKVAAFLAQDGRHQVIAQDQPGHGLRARFPRAYLERPLDRAKFAAEPSPLARMSVDDWADEVAALVSRLATRTPDRQVVLLGHSMAGLVLNRVGEAIPHYVGRLVYLSGWMTAHRRPFTEYAAAPEFAAGMIPSLLIGDPAVTGAVRFDFRSADPAYRARLKAAFAADVDDDGWEAVMNLLTPDTPAAPMAEPVAVSADRWGRIPRTYISCTADRAVPVAAQRRFIDEADAFTPDNPTDVRELPTSHSPFLSAPERLARILLQL